MPKKDFKVSDYAVMSQLKKKIKEYLVEKGCQNFKISSFGKGIVLSLIYLLDEIYNDSINLVEKNLAGLYVINPLVFKSCIDNEKYNFLRKYERKYSSTVRYKDSLFFNFNDTLAYLETVHGEKIMVEDKTKNLLAYYLLSFQYDLVDLCISATKFAGKRTLGLKSLIMGLEYVLTQGDLFSKINLKLDCINTENQEKEENEENENKGDSVDEDRDDGDDGDESDNDSEASEKEEVIKEADVKDDDKSEVVVEVEVKEESKKNKQDKQDKQNKKDKNDKKKDKDEQVESVSKNKVKEEKEESKDKKKKITTESSGSKSPKKKDKSKKTSK
jgi:hypothetical protein